MLDIAGLQGTGCGMITSYALPKTAEVLPFSYDLGRLYFQELSELNSYIRRIIYYLEVMFLMQLSENIHDGHGPGVLRPEDLQYRRHTLVQVTMKNPQDLKWWSQVSICQFS